MSKTAAGASAVAAWAGPNGDIVAYGGGPEVKFTAAFLYELTVQRTRRFSLLKLRDRISRSMWRLMTTEERSLLWLSRLMARGLRLVMYVPSAVAGL